MSVTIHPFFEPTSGSYSFIVANPDSKTCAIVDAALGICAQEGHLEGGSQPLLNTDCADSMVDWVEAHGYVARWILETHVHADRPSASGYLKSKLLCAQTAIGAHMPSVSGYDKLLQEGDKICLGHTCGRVMETPGHTPGCVSYQFEEAVFVGDTLFMPDSGTARCDFPGGNPATLYQSIQRILALPETTRIYVCHDYGHNAQGEPRRSRFVTTVAEEKQQNIHVGGTAPVEKFVDLRRTRDASLATPKWAHLSIPANLACMNLRSIGGLVQELGAGQH